MTSPRLRLHYFLSHSYSNGPGNRAVVWVQGCTLGCPDCFNPMTHPLNGGKWVIVDDLVRDIISLRTQIDGITISGGEPLQQYEAVTALLNKIKAETNLSVLLFTGFTWTEIVRIQQSMQSIGDITRYIDLLIAGRYVATQHLALDLRGSANKTLHFLTNRYTLNDLRFVPSAEVMISSTGEVILSGIDPLRW